MKTDIEALTSLHTTLVDSLHGYQEALKDADSSSITPLLRDMVAIRTQAADEIGDVLTGLGEPASNDGSLLSTVHHAVISIRSLFSGINESMIPGLIDGEQRILGYYDEALAAAPVDGPERALLVHQRAALESKISEFKAQLPTHAA